jgi:hypothetical protein
MNTTTTAEEAPESPDWHEPVEKPTRRGSRACGRSASLAEIAARCGRVEIAANGSAKGESSWVARRVGLAGDGHGAPRRWIDVDVLAQIAAAISLTAADVEL